MSPTPQRVNGAMGGIVSVARHTLHQCLRMKVVGIFIVVIAAILVALPFMASGDGTLAGRLRSFLSYGMSLLSVALSILTIFLSIWVVSEDVRTRQVFSVAVKPLARWQYILGRWAGICVLCVGMLVIGSGVIFAMAHYLGSGGISAPVNAEDDLAVETEVLAARRRVYPAQIGDLAERVAKKLAEMKEDRSEYAKTLEAFMARTGSGEAEAEEAMLEELAEQIGKGMYSVPSGRSIEWSFSGIQAKGASTEAVGEIVGVNRDANVLVVSVPPAILRRAVFDGPIFLRQVYEGRVRMVHDDQIHLIMSLDDMMKPELGVLSPGDRVDVRVDPMIQLTYKVDLTRRTSDNRFSSQWRFTNPTTGFQQTRFRSDPSDTSSTLTISARVVDEDGRTEVTFVNRHHHVTGEPTTVTILPENVAILFNVGSFSANFPRSVFLLALQVVYLAAAGVFAASFLVFPVACVLSFSLLPFSVAGGFLRDAVDPRYLPDAMIVSHYIVSVARVLLPDFESTSPGEWLINGLSIPWSFLGHVALWTFVVRTGLLLLAAAWIFSRRELARVQI